MNTIKFKVINWLLEVITFIILTTTLIWVTYNYSDISDTVPTHFNWQGESDAFGNKIQIVIPMVALVCVYLSLIIISNRLLKQSYNSKKMYSEIIFHQLIKLIPVSVLSYIIYEMGNPNPVKSKSLGFFFIPTIILLIMIALIGFIWAVRFK